MDHLATLRESLVVYGRAGTHDPVLYRSYRLDRLCSLVAISYHLPLSHHRCIRRNSRYSCLHAVVISLCSVRVKTTAIETSTVNLRGSPDSVVVDLINQDTAGQHLFTIQPNSKRVAKTLLDLSLLMITLFHVVVVN